VTAIDLFYHIECGKCLIRRYHNPYRCELYYERFSSVMLNSPLCLCEDRLGRCSRMLGCCCLFFFGLLGCWHF